MRRIDAHHHVWDLSRRSHTWTAGLGPLERSFTYDELLRQLHAGYATWVQVSDAVLAGLSVDEAHEVRGGTACRVYGLRGAA